MAAHQDIVTGAGWIVLGGAAGPGPVTSKLHDLYWEKRWGGWLATPVDYDAPVGPAPKKK